jgi:hypothetical protein
LGASKKKINMDKERFKNFLKKGSEITGGAVGGAIGLIGGPAGAIAGGGLGVLTAQLMNEVIERSLSDRQKVRIAATSTFLFEGIAKRIERGESIRDDDFFEKKIYDRSNAEELFEGTLLKCSSQFQEKKIKYISKIFEKTVFDKSVSVESAHQLLVIVESLTYRKLCILSFYGRRSIDFIGEVLMKDVYSRYPNIVFTTNEKLLLQDLMELINLDLLDKQNWMLNSNKDITPNILTLTEIGQSLFDIMDLIEIEPKDLMPIIEGLKYRNEWGKSTNGTVNGEQL